MALFNLLNRPNVPVTETVGQVDFHKSRSLPATTTIYWGERTFAPNPWG
jgi:hypothetical protein